MAGEAKGITIDVPEIEDFEQKILDAVVHKLLYTHSIGDGENGDAGYTYASSLSNRLREDMKKVIEEQAREACPVVAAEILDQGVWRTDQWGDRSGSGPLPLKTLVAEEIQKSMTGYGSRRDELGKLAREEIAAQVQAQMKGALAEVTGPILEQLRAEATAVFIRALQKSMPEVDFDALTKPPADDDVSF